MKTAIEHSGFELVDSVEHLYRLSIARRACYHSVLNRIIPAKALLNWQGSQLIKSIMLGNIKIYPKPKKGKLE